MPYGHPVDADDAAGGIETNQVCCDVIGCEWDYALAYVFVPVDFNPHAQGGKGYSKIGVSFASTSSIISAGTLSSLRALREPKSRARG